MIIRKLFKFEGAHIVRNCSSDRCKFSLHGHSYKVEVFFTSKGLDNGQMVMDFGLMKGTIKDLIDSFDHAFSVWNKESDKFKNDIYEYSQRVIEMPCSPSAESYSLMFLFIIDKIVKATQFNNGEKMVSVSSVRVHETDTGYAESFIDDLHYIDYKLKDIVFSDAVKNEWTDPLMYSKLIISDSRGEKCFINKIVQQQV
ncbi:MAG: 6-carboxytetrahydropterin synthase [Sphaerochaeta sp.]|jgi:6-pyruvoyltetrahydropterin/6-carboxytetrahydropterin synthase